MNKSNKVYGVWFYHEIVRLTPLTRGDDRVWLTVADGTQYPIALSSVRMQCLRRDPTCVACGRTGLLWVLQDERTHLPGRFKPNLNLYAVDDDDQLILMTRDHVIPRCRGGSWELDNAQTMCSPCNNDKADSLHLNWIWRRVNDHM